jgi:hypothetical protein
MNKPFWSQLRRRITLKHVLLGISLVAFAIGFAGIGRSEIWDLAKPLGAVFFILYYIVMMLDKPVALYDKEHADLMAAADMKVTDSNSVLQKKVSKDSKSSSNLKTSTAH